MDNLFTQKRYYMDMLADAESQKDLRIYGQQQEINKGILRICKALQKGERDQSQYYIRRGAVTILNTALSGLLIYLFVCRSAYIGNISIGDVIVFSSSVVNLTTAISNIAVFVGHLKNMALYAQDYLEYMNLEKRKYDGTIPVEKRRDNRQCHLVYENLVKLRGKSSGLLLKNIFVNKFSIKLSSFKN